MRRFTTLRVLSMGLVLLAVAALLGWLLPRLRPARGTLYHFYVEDTAGLPEGTEVKFRGLVVGQVMRVGLDEERSLAARTPWFRVEFQSNDEGTRVMNLWSFRQVALDKETPIVGATVVTLTDPTMPGGQTPTVAALTLQKPGDNPLPGPVQEIADNLNEVLVNFNATVQSLRGSLSARPDTLGDDRHANLALCLERDVYPLAGPDAATGRPTRLASMLGSLGDAAASFQTVGDHLGTITGEDGSANRMLRRVDALAANLQDEDKPFLRVFTDIRKTSGELRGDLARVDTLLARVSPMIERTTSNTEQMSDTLKRQPWRVFWPSTKKYDGPAEATDPADLVLASNPPRKARSSARDRTSSASR